MLQIRDRWLLLSRIIVAVVMTWNLSAAIPFVLHPESYTASFGVQGGGIGGMVLVRGLGVAFLMWQIPYLPVIWHPGRHRTCFLCVLGMQLVGLLGETLMMVNFPPGYLAVKATGWRFILFDGSGLILMGTAYISLVVKGRFIKYV